MGKREQRERRVTGRSELWGLEREQPPVQRDLTGLDVYHSDDRLVGTVDQVVRDSTSGQQYLVVTSSPLGGTTIYVPQSAIQLATGDYVALKNRMEEFSDRVWTLPPSGRTSPGAWWALRKFTPLP
jgi:hypothetical protein